MQEGNTVRGKSGMIAISAGGTYGHLNPALQLHKAAKDRSFLIGIGLEESPFLQDKNIDKISLKGARRLGKLVQSCWQAFWALQKKNPKIVVCFGSFHSFPAAIVGLLLGKPIWVFEPNAEMGFVNRFFAFFAHKIVCYDTKLLKRYPHRGILLANEYPLIDREKSLSRFGLSGEKPILLIIGGSGGAQFLNRWAEENVEFLHDFSLIHLVGPKHDPEVFQALYQSQGIEAYVDRFIDRAEEAMGIADVALSRAGASTLRELNFYRVPTVIIPFQGAYQHQKQNGLQFLAQGGVGELIEESQKNTIASTVQRLQQESTTTVSEPTQNEGSLWSSIISSV